MKKIHYSWFICAGCTLVLFCTGGMAVTGFSTYLPYLISQKGLTNFQVSTIGFVRSLFGVLGMLIVNAFLKRFEIRRVVTAAMLVCAGAFVGYGFSQGFHGYLVSAAVVGIAYGFGSMIPVSILISRWFNDHRGLALGICMASTGVSTFVTAPIITALVERISLRGSFLIEAAFIAVSGVIVWCMLRSMPSCMDLEPLGAGHEEAQQYASRTAAKPLYLMMLVGWLFLGAAANNLHSHLSVLYQSVGFSSGQISMVISMFGLSLAAGKCVCGELSDKIGVFKSCMLLYIVSTIGTALCCMGRSVGFPIACAGVMMVGFGMAVATVATSTYAAGIASEKDYPRIVSRFQTMQTVGGLVFATVPGLLADRTGDYIIAYIIMLTFIVISAVILQTFYVIIRRQDGKRSGIIKAEQRARA